MKIPIAIGRVTQRSDLNKTSLCGTPLLSISVLKLFLRQLLIEINFMMMNSRIPAAFVICSILFCSCKQGHKKQKKEDKQETTENVAPPIDSIHYDFSNPLNKWVLPDELIEISGIAPLEPGKILAIEDLHPLLYVIKLDSSRGTIIDTVSFHETSKEKFDMEDLALIGDTVYALWSHGAVFKIRDWKHKREVTKFKTQLSKENNTEGMAFDTVTGDLLIVCKNESEMEDEKKSTRSVFEYDVKADTLKADPFLLIKKEQFKELSGDKIDFYPSAIAVHPVTHDVYVMSTKDTKCIAQFGHDGTLKALQYLDKDMFLQPEGICFDPAGNLYISTEGKHGDPPYIYEFAELKLK